MSAVREVVDGAIYAASAPMGTVVSRGTSADHHTDLFEQPVPRRYVHRAAVSEVLLTHFAEDELPNSFRISAQWPRAHGYYRPVDGRHDPMLLTETIRQAGLMVGHVGYGIPLDHRFIMSRISIDLGAEGVDCGGKPTNLVLSVSCINLKYRGRQVIGCEGLVAVYDGSTQVGAGSFRFVSSSPAVYNRMRASAGLTEPRPEVPAPLPAVAPELVARLTASEVVLADAAPGEGWLLRCNPEHPILFDHPVDHVPGMVLMEAARQAAHRLLQPAGVTLTGMVGDFDQYAELHLPTEIRAHLEAPLSDGSVMVRVVMTQAGGQVASILATALAAG